MLMAAALFGSWFRCQENYRDGKGRWFIRYAPQESLWKTVDYNVFLTLNGTMRDNPVMQKVWGVSNHRSFDLASAAWMAVLFLIYYVRNPRNENRAELIQFGLYIAVMLLAVTLFAELLIQFHRCSPAATEGLKERAVLLTELKDVVPWEVKVTSNNSFPGDHATVLLFVGLCILWRLRSWYGAAAVFGIVLFSLPRLAGGGHWASDVLAGSLPLFLAGFSLFMCEPLRQRAMSCLRKPADWIYSHLRRFETSRG
jgi:membrane-associated phospholipid phosphatase